MVSGTKTKTKMAATAQTVPWRRKREKRPKEAIMEGMILTSTKEVMLLSSTVVVLPEVLGPT